MIEEFVCARGIHEGAALKAQELQVQPSKRQLRKHRKKTANPGHEHTGYLNEKLREKK